MIPMRYFIFFLFILIGSSAHAQHPDYIVSGPMLGHTELRSCKVWVEYKEAVKGVQVHFFEEANPSQRKTGKPLTGVNPYFNIVHYELNDLKPGTAYRYELVAADKRVIFAGGFRTQELWQWRKPAPDFSFLAGSCSYFNEAPYDRPGRPYGGDSTIFLTMAKEQASFMLWLGDNWYTREVDYYSAWGLHKRAATDRQLPILQPFWHAMPHYAIWDDHDYGWNDGDKSYPLKEASRAAFNSYWANPSSGMNGQGIYSKFSWNDVDVFLLDDRWYRSNDSMKDSVNGQPNPEKEMFGAEQLQWLKNALLQSNANGGISFRIIATGSQMLNPNSPYDCFRRFPKEYDELMQFLKDNRINGVVFMTGDRHHSEIIKVDRTGTYPLYDITSSPLTSGTHSFGGPEKDNPYRVVGVDKLQNYSRISFSGKGAERTMKIEYLGVKGEPLANWSVSLQQLSTPRTRN